MYFHYDMISHVITFITSIVFTLYMIVHLGLP